MPFSREIEVLTLQSTLFKYHRKN